MPPVYPLSPQSPLPACCTYGLAGSDTAAASNLHLALLAPVPGGSVEGSIHVRQSTVDEELSATSTGEISRASAAEPGFHNNASALAIGCSAELRGCAPSFRNCNGFTVHNPPSTGLALPASRGTAHISSRCLGQSSARAYTTHGRSRAGVTHELANLQFRSPAAWAPVLPQLYTCRATARHYQCRCLQASAADTWLTSLSLLSCLLAFSRTSSALDMTLLCFNKNIATTVPSEVCYGTLSGLVPALSTNRLQRGANCS